VRWLLAIVAVVCVATVAASLVGLFGPRSFRAEFAAATRARSSPAGRPSLVDEADLARLPVPVATYLRTIGVVGRPQVHDYRLHFTGRIRSGPESRWMPFSADQYSRVAGPTRIFLMRARMYGVPVEAFHRYERGRATMRVRLMGFVPVAGASGKVMDTSETVTVLNDMALLAPPSLLDSRIQWEPIDERSATALFTVDGTTVAATLSFDSEGLLSNFVSEDRSRSSSDGRTFTRLRFSTPVSDYRDFGGVRLPAYGEAWWHAPDGAFAYGEFRLREAVWNDGR
jgi:hypothetical protein